MHQADGEEIAKVRTMTIRHPRRLPLLALGMVALLTGLWAGSRVSAGMFPYLVRSSLPCMVP